jgi:hypothetical protein
MVCAKLFVRLEYVTPYTSSFISHRPPLQMGSSAKKKKEKKKDFQVCGYRNGVGSREV